MTTANLRAWCISSPCLQWLWPLQRQQLLRHLGRSPATSALSRLCSWVFLECCGLLARILKTKGWYWAPASHPPLCFTVLCLSGNPFFMSCTPEVKDFGFPQRFLSWQNVPVCCPSSGGEEEGKHFCLLSLVYVIDAGTFNFPDKWCISGTEHTGSHGARELSAHAVLSKQSTDLNCWQLTVIIKCMLVGGTMRFFPLMRQMHKHLRVVLPWKCKRKSQSLCRSVWGKDHFCECFHFS